jgi:transcriptional regulator with XRE-family HTH domain
LRTKLGFTQTRLAEEAGVDESAIRLWEDGRQRPRGAALARLLLALAGEPPLEQREPPPVPTDAPSQESPSDDTQSTMLDVALRNWLIAARARNDEWTDALLGRFGWDRAQPLTLEAAGRLIHVSRQAVEQEEKKARTALSVTPAPRRLLEEAAEQLWAIAPTTNENAVEALFLSGTTNKPISAEGLSLACRLAGVVDPPVTDGLFVATSDDELKSHRALIGAIERRCRLGVPVPVDALTSLDESERSTSEVKEVLESLDWVLWLSPEWVADRRRLEQRGRVSLLTNINKVLVACGPVGVASLWRGLKRVQRRPGRLPNLPPAEVLEPFLNAHPSYSVRDGNVAPNVELSPTDVLSEGDAVVVRELQAAPAGVRSYAELRRAFLDAGFSEQLLGQQAQFAPHMMRIRRDTWGLRSDAPEYFGESDEVDPELALRLRAARIGHGLTQAALARRVGVHQAEISRWETGRDPVPSDKRRVIEQLFGPVPQRLSGTDV